MALLSIRLLVFILSLLILGVDLYNSYVLTTRRAGGGTWVLGFLLLTAFFSGISVIFGLYRQIVWCLRATFVNMAAHIGLIIGVAMSRSGVFKILLSVLGLAMATLNAFQVWQLIKDIQNKRATSYPTECKTGANRALV